MWKCFEKWTVSFKWKCNEGPVLWVAEYRLGYIECFCFLFFYFIFIYFKWRLIILQYCIGSATHQHESAMGIHVFPILIPSHLPPRIIPLGHPSAPAPSILYWTWTGDSFLIWYYTCFSAIPPNRPTLSLSHRVQKTALYICVSFAVLHTGLSLPSF